jgi:broad specificity phosphatase PhoE
MRLIFRVLFIIVPILSNLQASAVHRNKGSEGKLTQIFFVRHGQTQWNIVGKCQGQTDIPLNDQGIEQARKLAQKLKIYIDEIDVIYSSDLQRAHATAIEIGTAIEKEVHLDSDLREMFHGKAQGMTKKEIHDAFGELQDAFNKKYPNFRERWNYTVIPGAETRNQVLHRLFNFLDRIVPLHKGKIIIIVTHSDVIKSFITHCSNLTQEPSNCGIAEFLYDSTKNKDIQYTFCGINELNESNN